MQEAMTNAMDHASPTYDIRGVSGTGPGIYRGSSAQPGSTGETLGGQYLFETSDGWLTALASGGLWPTANVTIDWLAESGEAQGLDGTRVATEAPSIAPPPSPDDRPTLSRSCARSAQAAEGRARRGSTAPELARLLSPCDIVESQHLAVATTGARSARGPRRIIPLPGATLPAQRNTELQRGRAQLGEHNADVFSELGLDDADLRRLKMRMVI